MQIIGVLGICVVCCSVTHYFFVHDSALLPDRTTLRAQLLVQRVHRHRLPCASVNANQYFSSRE